MSADQQVGVHPVAALFPMMSDEELDDLAEDIKANGLIHPIVRNADGVLIDGRNRLEACRRAEVEPSFVELDGHDPVAFILSANITRRHLSKGQIAMAVAKAGKFSSGKFEGKGIASDEARVSNSGLSKAITILEHAPELADRVLSGEPGWALNVAYVEAVKLKNARAESDALVAQREAEEASVRQEAPDLWRLVEDGELPFEDAVAANKERQRVERDRRERVVVYFTGSLIQLDSFRQSPRDFLADWLRDANPHRESEVSAHLWTPDGVRNIGHWLLELGDKLEAKGATL